MRATAGGGRTTLPNKFTPIEGVGFTIPVLIFVFFATLLAGIPVFIALAFSSLLYTHFIANIPDFVILHRMAGGLDSFSPLAGPFFILAGDLLDSARITNRILA